MFSICLKILAQKSVIEFTDCVEVGKRFEMNEDAVKLSCSKIPSQVYRASDVLSERQKAQNFVICDPQAVFTSISDRAHNYLIFMIKKKKG